MSFADWKKKITGAPASADPSRAFGSEAEMMEALRRQEFTPPKPRPTAANVMDSIRQRLSRPAPEERPDVSRAYAPEAMGQPEWENPFTAPEKPARPQRSAPVYEPLAGDMPFERRPAAAYAPQSYAAPYGGYAAPGMAPPPYYAPYGAPAYEPYGAPVYDPRYAPPEMPYAPGAYYPPEGYAAPAYAPAPEYAAPTPAYAPAYAAAQGYAPAPGYAPPEYAAAPAYVAAPGHAPAPGYAPPEYAAPDGYPPEYMPPEYAGEPACPPQNSGAPAAHRRKKLAGADLRYLLWSGSIVSGIALTVVAFIVACAS